MDEDTRRGQIMTSFQDKEYRHLYSAALIQRGTAIQIREMRLHRGWRQADLAEACGKKQETICQIENPDYEGRTLKTLQRIAEAFDVALIVRFVPFSQLAAYEANLSPGDLAVPAFEMNGD